MRARRSKKRFPDAWRAIAAERVRQWPALDDAQRHRMEQLAMLLLSKRWEASHGFSVDDAMRVTVAANAALLHLGHAEDKPFGNVTSVVLHPSTIVLRGERPGPMPGVMTDAPMAAHGHTSARGPVHIAWDTVERELHTHNRSANVILHEFAHKIDALNGTFDGTPRLADPEQLREWVAVCTAELQALRRGEAGVLRSYAATNPSEFFAVATEAFFEQPAALRAGKPPLYDVLARYYGQDPAARETRDDAGAPQTMTVTTGLGAAVTTTITPSG
jgi:MtfA peptidase